MSEYTVTNLPVSSLYQVVGIEDINYQRKINQSVAEVGVLKPLIVVIMNRSEWYELKSNVRSDVLDPPDEVGELPVYAVVCGNQRLRALIHLKQERVDCIVFTYQDREKAFKLCQQERTSKLAEFQRNKDGYVVVSMSVKTREQLSEFERNCSELLERGYEPVGGLATLPPTQLMQSFINRRT